MDRRTVFTKTAKGMLEATGKTSNLSRDLRNILKEVDGKATVGKITERLGKITEPKLLAALEKMLDGGYVREFVTARSGPTAPSQRAASAECRRRRRRRSGFFQPDRQARRQGGRGRAAESRSRRESEG